MTHLVYGFRNVGSAEIRYVGQTKHSGDHRLKFETGLARKRVRRNLWDAWLLGSHGPVEAIVIALCCGETDARIQERAVIRTCAAIGHRLFNVQGMPKVAQIATLEAVEPYRKPSTSSVAA